MCREQNKAIASRWFTEFWGRRCNLAVVDELAASDMLLQYSPNARCRGHDAVKAFMQALRAAVPNLDVRSAADITAEGDFVICRWEGDGTHAGRAFGDFPTGALPRAFGRRMRFAGRTILRVENGKIAEEAVWTTGLTVFRQLRVVARDEPGRGTAAAPRATDARRRAVPG